MSNVNTARNYFKVNTCINHLRFLSYSAERCRKGFFLCSCGEVKLMDLTRVYIGRTRSCGCMNKR